MDDTTYGGLSSAHHQPTSSTTSGGHNASSSSGRRQRSSLMSFGSRSRPTSVGPMPERPPYNVPLNDLPPTPAIPQQYMYAGHTPPGDPNGSYLSTSEYSTSSSSSSSARVFAQYKGKGKEKIKYGGGGNGIGNDSGVSAHQYSSASSSHHPPPMSPNDSGWMGSPPTLGGRSEYHASPATLEAGLATQHQQYAAPDAHGTWRSGATNHAEVVVHNPCGAGASVSAHDMMHLQSFEASILDCTLLTRKPSNSSESDAAIGSPEFDPAPTSVTASPASSSITSPGLAPLTSVHASTPGGGFHPGPRPRPVNQPPPSAAVTQRRPSVRGELLRKCLARVERDRMAAQQQNQVDGFGRTPPATAAASSALAYAANSNAYTSSSSSSNDQSESAYSTSESQSQTHSSDYSPPATESSSSGDTGTSTSTSQSSTPYSTSTDGIVRRPSQRQNQPVDSARTSIASLSPGNDSFTPNMYMTEIQEEDESDDHHGGHTEATSATGSGSGGSSTANKAMILSAEERLSSAESVANSLNDLLREYGAQSPTTTTVGTASSSPTREEYLTAGSTSPYGVGPGNATAVEGTGRTSPVLQRIKPRPPALPRLSPNVPMSVPPGLPSPVTPNSVHEANPLHVHFNNDSTIKFGLAASAGPVASASSSGASTPLSPMSPTVMCDAAVVRNLVAYVGIPFQYILTLPPPPAGSRRWSKQGTLGMFTRVKMSLGSQLARSLQYPECSFESAEDHEAACASRGMNAGMNPGAWPVSPKSPAATGHNADGLDAGRRDHSSGNSSTKAVKSPSTSVASGMSVIGGLPGAPSAVEHCYPAGMTAKEAARMTYPNRFQQHLSIVIPSHAGQSSSSSGNRITRDHPDSYDPLDSPTLSTAATAGSRAPSSAMHRESALGLMFPMAAATEVHLAPPWLAADVDAVKRSGVLRGTPLAGDVGDWTVEVVDKRTMPCPGSSPKVARNRAPPAHHGGEHNAHEVVIWKAVVRVTAR
ncbi:hypothetical protein BCR44DRAFT_84596 [Catenaria anguillulae PL171]|uniref:Uncharacterized protein n=1 Tax=Catenaria anguillulae PL171 TaxID=765915 RepID=A0A1Y2I3J8_9FUNG|nr:hypothetical protein BCR44DRAFT_84596 [Catenaria anguillulae PL171]